MVLDPYYSNETEIFKSEEHHGGVKIMRLPTNLFGLPTKHKFDVRILFIVHETDCHIASYRMII